MGNQKVIKRPRNVIQEDVANLNGNLSIPKLDIDEYCLWSLIKERIGNRGCLD